MISIADFKTGLRMRGFTYDNRLNMYKSPADESNNHYWLDASEDDEYIYLCRSPFTSHKKFNKKMLLWVPERYNTIEAFESELDRMETAYMLEKL